MSGQIIPDGTTDTPNPGLCTVGCTITGGTISSAGTNLFHSFEQFLVPNGSVVTFDHDPAVINILARVTGGNVSMIDGLLRNDVTSDTNLFLINPSGIVFGSGGGLDLGGSFVATTADAIQFDGQGEFSAIEPQANPTSLTVNPSALLFSQIAPQPIVNQANFNSTTFSLGLSVQESKSLLLVGGDVISEPPSGSFGGFITAPSGQVELGGVSGPAIVGLDVEGNNLSLSYPSDTALADVFLDNIAIDISNFFSVDRAAGSLVINANSISLLNTFIFSTTDGPDNAGNILIRATDSVAIDSSGFDSSTLDSGNGGSISISTGLLSLENFSILRFGTNGPGSAGNVFIDADDVVFSDSFIVTEANDNDIGPTGNVGEIKIQAGTLSLTNGSEISTETFGQATNTETSGIIRIDAKEIVLLTDESSITSETFGERNASNIILNTPELIVEDFASISATTVAAGNAGTILINGSNQIILSTGSVTTETAAGGSGGNIIVNTEQFVANSSARITATATATAEPTTKGGNIALNADKINLSGEETGVLAETEGPAEAGFIAIGANNNGEALTVIFQEGAEISAATSSNGEGGRVVASAEAVTFTGDGSLSTRSTGSGPAGDVSIQTDGLLRVQDGARVEVSGESTGDSGTLDIASGIAILDGGQLLASTQAGADGNIELRAEDALVVRGDSLISAEAFNDADGGNVDIASPFIIALFADGPNGNDIQASAVDGNGGRITIQTNALFNFAENVAEDGNMTNDLDATSGTGIDGEVVIQNLEVDPVQGTVTLPVDTANPELGQGCQASGSGQFTASGQGGIRPDPYAPLSEDGIQEDIDLPSQVTAQIRNVDNITENTERLTEAQGWGRNAQGETVLTAESAEYYSSCQHTLTGVS
ncbi:MAG: filamentous hemagglutinin N-terminal domain-containing protein [Leptolyngbyaceae cyanobacterium]